MPVTTDEKILRTVRRNLFFILVAATTLGFLGLTGPFLLTVFWAAVLAVIFMRPYRWILVKLRGREGLAAGLATTMITLFVIVPILLLGLALVQQGLGVYAQVQDGSLNPNVVIDYVDQQLPLVAKSLSDFGVSTDDLRTRLQEFAVTTGELIASRALTVTGSIVNAVVQFTLMLYLLYFFLRDGRRIVRRMIDILPMGNTRERTLFYRFAQVSRATLKGTLIVAFVQGAIGGVLFAVLGIPAALLWGVAMMLLALLPVGGSAIVWVPAAVILFVQGAVGKAIAIVVVGALIIGLVDNLLRPLLVGRDTEMPDYLVLISTLGGITFFGLSGFVIGPVVAALFITVWEMMGHDYGGKLG